MMAATTVLIGLLGFVVWGHHMFVSGMNPYAGTAFALTTMAIAVPSTAKVFSWLGTLWGGGIARTHRCSSRSASSRSSSPAASPGPSSPCPRSISYLHNTFFVVAHFHLIMAMAGVFSIFAGIYYWFPLMTGRLMSERLGRWHFWLSLIAAYGTFFPMHLEGLAGRPRHYAQVTGSTSSLASLLPMERGVTWAAFVARRSAVDLPHQSHLERPPRHARRRQPLARHHAGMAARRPPHHRRARPLRVPIPGHPAPTSLHSGRRHPNRSKL